MFGFQSSHNPLQNGTLRVSGATANDGPLPLFSRDITHPRGILGGQDPNDIAVYWGITLTAMLEDSTSPLAGDFNGDNVVDTADVVVWRKNLGAPTESNLNNNGDGLNGVDVGDYQLWRRNFGVTAATATSSSSVVAEPASAIFLLIAGCGLLAFGRPRRRTETTSWCSLASHMADVTRTIIIIGAFGRSLIQPKLSDPGSWGANAQIPVIRQFFKIGIATFDLRVANQYLIY